MARAPKDDTPVGGWLGPNTPDPEGRDMIDEAFAPAADRKAIAVAAAPGRGIAGWKWRALTAADIEAERARQAARTAAEAAYRAAFGEGEK